MEIDRNSPLTLAYQLTSILRNDILGLKYSESSKLPTEDGLIEKYRVSRITVRRALDNLVQESLVRRERGKGTFVNSLKVISDITRLKSTTQIFRAAKIKPQIQVIGIRKEVPPQFISNRLKLEDTDAVFKLERIRIGNNEPLIIETNYLPEKLFPELEKHDLSLSLYETMASKYDIYLTRASETFTVISLNKIDAEILKCKSKSPAIKMVGIVYRAGDIPTSYEESIYRGDRFVIKVESSSDQYRGAHLAM